MSNDSGLDIPFYGGTSNNSVTLEKQIEQIISQRGLFRDIREKDLEDEIQQAGLDSVAEDFVLISRDSDESEDESLQTQQDKLWKSRDDMVKKLSYAQNEILSALDFISLLLSNHNVSAQTSMSPALKELVPPKTLECRITDHEIAPTKHRSKLQEVSDGWKAESFHSASAKLRKASLHLQRETDGQGKYWYQVALLKSQGWAVSRLPTDSQAIGVHIGFQESASQFRSKGFALLQQERSGNLQLDPRRVQKNKTTITVEILSSGITTGSYVISPGNTSSANDTVESRLTIARDTLFLEELFYEISREARHISNQGVRFQQSCIEADVSDQTRIRIIQSTESPRTKLEVSHDDDDLARVIASCLQMLLISEHARLHSLRCKPPPPMTAEPPRVPELAILRPILARVRHASYLRSVMQLCRHYIPLLRSAGIKLTVERRQVGIPTSGSNTFASLRQLVSSEIVLRIATAPRLAIMLETYLATPIYGTTFKTSTTGISFIPSRPNVVDNITGLQASIADFVTLAVLSYLQERLVSIQESLNLENHLQWTVYKPHSGEIVAVSGVKNIGKVIVGTKADRVFLHSISTMANHAEKPQKLEFNWTRTGLETDQDQGSSEPDPRTMDIVITEIDTLLRSRM